MTDQEQKAMEMAYQALTAICTSKLPNTKERLGSLRDIMREGDFIDIGGLGYEAWMEVGEVLGKIKRPIYTVVNSTQWCST